MTLLMDDYHCQQVILQYVEPHKALYMSTQDPCTIKCNLERLLLFFHSGWGDGGGFQQELHLFRIGLVVVNLRDLTFFCRWSEHFSCATVQQPK